MSKVLTITSTGGPEHLSFTFDNVTNCGLLEYLRHMGCAILTCHCGGERIRTSGTLARTQHFQCCPLGHSGTHPVRRGCQEPRWPFDSLRLLRVLRVIRWFTLRAPRPKAGGPAGGSR